MNLIGLNQPTTKSNRPIENTFEILSFEHTLSWILCGQIVKADNFIFGSYEWYICEYVFEKL